MSTTKEPAWVSGALGSALGAIAPKFMNIPTPANAPAPVDQPASIILITPEQLRYCAPTISTQRSNVMANLLNQLCPAYGINTKDVFHEFLANVLQESYEFTHRVENMYYRAQTLANTWPGRFSKTAKKPFAPNDLAYKYEKKPKELALFVYGSRMGNRSGTDDGWNLRGGGFIGLTGYWVYEAFRKFKGFKTVEETAQYVRDSDYGGLEAALWYFCVLKDLMDEAERDEMIGIVKEINGGLIGLDDRMIYLKRILKYVV